MGKPGGKLPERHQFLLLRFHARHFADAVGHQADQTLAKLRHALQQFRELLFVEAKHPRRQNGARNATNLSETRKGKQPGNLAGSGHENRRTRSIRTFKLNLAFEDNVKIIDGVARAGEHFSRLQAHFVHARGQPLQIFRGQIREDGDGA